MTHHESRAKPSEMVRRVAEALCAAAGEKPNRVWRSEDDQKSALGWEFYVTEAEAAIQALRDPPPAIICAVEDMAEERYKAAPMMLRWYGEDVWNAGIDAALSDSRTGADQAEVEG